jgi:diaminopimelate decarboxylase
MPVGMEMFSAGDEQQWDLIKRQIDDCDYYVVVLAHRYGSKDGAVSYTEKEYDYAVSKKIPVLGFLISEDAPWPKMKIDIEQEAQSSLASFKQKVKRKMVAFWRNADDLHGKVAISLLKAFAAYPRAGWTRTPQDSGLDVGTELSRIKREIASLQSAIDTPKSEEKSRENIFLGKLAKYLVDVVDDSSSVPRILTEYFDDEVDDSSRAIRSLTEKASPRPFDFPTPDSSLSCGKVSLERLAQKFGTPLYVYSSDQIAERLALFQEALAGREHLVCYAVKANSSLAILKLLADRGAGFNVVSGGELERVLKAAPEAAGRVVFSGVGKTATEMDLALEAAILEFNVESEGELELLAERACKLKCRARFALRVNPEIFAETHPYISTGLRENKFGVDIRQARRIYKSVATNKWLDATGVCVHIGSQIRSPQPFGLAMDRVAKLVSDLARDGIALTSIDAGGGLGIDYHSSTAFDVKSSVKRYAKALGEALAGFDGRLIIEPGRFLVAQAGALLARVLYVKRNGKKTFVITDAAMNDLIRPALYQAHHEIVPVRPRAGRARKVDVVGPISESGDFFAHDRTLQPLEPGDLVAVLDAGAYAMAQSSNYNSRKRAAEVLVEGARARVIRRRETMADLMRAESD